MKYIKVNYKQTSTNFSYFRYISLLLDIIFKLRGPTHQKWSNFAIFGFIVQFDPWVGVHLWKKIRVLGALETPQMGGGERSPPHWAKFESLPILLKLGYYM